MNFIATIALLFGPLLLTGGISSYFLTSFFVRFLSQKLLVIEAGTIFYEKWIKIPIPLSVDLFIFDIQGDHEVSDLFNNSNILVLMMYSSGQLPVVREIGPFRFSQTREKKIINYSADKETVTYVESKRFNFDREKSVGDLDRYFITPNVAFLSTIKVWNSYLKDFPFSVIVQPLAERFLSTVMEYYQQNLFINVTIDQMMFRGIHLNFAPLLRSLADLFGRFGIGSEIGALSNDSFYFFKYINHTKNGPYEVYTGKSDISKLTQLKKYRGQAVLDIWDNNECNTVRGSDGVQFEPLKKDKSQIYVFTHELCRAITLEYKRDSEVRGIRTLRYEPPASFFSNKKSPSSKEKCDCTESHYCKNPGVIDLSPCWFKAPLYGSVPHFAGDEFSEIRKSIIGLQPNVSKHKSFIDLDPLTGSTLRGTKRGQINTHIERLSSMRSTRAVKDSLFLPLFWFDEYGEIDDKLEDEIKMKSVYPLMVVNYLTMLSLISGSFFSLLSCLVFICCRNKVHHKAKRSEANELYLDDNYRKLLNFDAERESARTESSAVSLEHTKTISIISNNSMDSMARAEFVLVQPMQPENSLSIENHTQNMHSLAIVPAYQRLPIVVNDHQPQQQSLNGKVPAFKSQIESNNYIPSVDYQIPSPQAIDESMQAISKFIELNSQNMADRNDQMTNNLYLIPTSQIPPVAQLIQIDNSPHSQLINHRRPRSVKQLSSKSNSFD